MTAIKEELKDTNERIAFKEKRCQAGIMAENYKLCDQLKEEAAALKQQRRELEAELKDFQLREKRSRKYYQRKKEASSESDKDTHGSSSETDLSTTSFRSRRSSSCLSSTSPSASLAFPMSASGGSCMQSPRELRFGPIGALRPHLCSALVRSVLLLEAQHLHLCFTHFLPQQSTVVHSALLVSVLRAQHPYMHLGIDQGFLEDQYLHLCSILFQSDTLLNFIHQGCTWMNHWKGVSSIQWRYPTLNRALLC